mmetsp:Transcript_3421/g.5272  ORF Transcript_3421/g.5272 Transcript_3421/m.5272 type:complete len:481 (+) Transcript_3421:1-1443(+)
MLSNIARSASSLFKKPRNSKFKSLQDQDIKFFESVMPKSCLLQEDLDSYNEDWLGICKGNSSLVIKPKTTQQVQEVLKYCNQNMLAVVPQGGNTGQVAGGVPIHDEIVLNLSNMNKINKIDQDLGVVWSEGGTILENLNNYCEESGYIVPLDLGAKGSCQIAGNVATNAAGLKLLRYGSMHANVLGVEAVLPNGEVMCDMKALRKDNTGYDLKNLFVGSEGTLGVLTQVALLLAPKPASRKVAFLGLDSYEKVITLLGRSKKQLGEILSAFEFMDNSLHELVLKNVPNTRSMLGQTYPFYVVVETSGSSEVHDSEKFERFLESVMEEDLINDGIVSQDQKQFDEIWQLRDSAALAYKDEGYVFNYDFSLSVKEMYNFVEKTKARLPSEDFVTGYGHVGDGNVHLVVATQDPQRVKETLEPFVFEMLQEYQGSVSAEHGVGLTKVDKLSYCKSPESLKLMKKIKQTFDPNGILNPYKVIEP